MADERTADAEMVEEGITGVEMVDEEDCVLLAVMGVTGAGKSSLIKAITGSEEIVVGNSLTSGILIDIRPFLAIILTCNFRNLTNRSLQVPLQRFQLHPRRYTRLQRHKSQQYRPHRPPNPRIRRLLALCDIQGRTPALWHYISSSHHKSQSTRFNNDADPSSETAVRREVLRQGHVRHDVLGEGRPR
jgi:hypothetical protein